MVIFHSSTSQYEDLSRLPRKLPTEVGFDPVIFNFIRIILGLMRITFLSRGINMLAIRNTFILDFNTGDELNY